MFVCVCASFNASLFCLQRVFINISPLWNVIYIFLREWMLMWTRAVITFCQHLHLLPSLDGCVSKHSWTPFIAWRAFHAHSLICLFGMSQSCASECHVSPVIQTLQFWHHLISVSLCMIWKLIFLRIKENYAYIKFLVRLAVLCAVCQALSKLTVSQCVYLIDVMKEMEEGW